MGMLYDNALPILAATWTTPLSDQQPTALHLKTYKLKGGPHTRAFGGLIRPILWAAVVLRELRPMGTSFKFAL